MSVNSVSMFPVPKFLGEFEWPSLTHMAILGPITKGMSHTPSGMLAGKVPQKGGLGKRKWWMYLEQEPSKTYHGHVFLEEGDTFDYTVVRTFKIKKNKNSSPFFVVKANSLFVAKTHLRLWIFSFSPTNDP